MKIRLQLVGKSPLLMHDPRLADPDDETVKEIKKITDKRKKTEQDRRDIEHLEWFGGLVLGPDGRPAVKSGAVRKCLINAGKISKQGTQIARGVAFQDLTVPLDYDGPRDPQMLWQQKSFHNRASVGIGRSRTMRMRPQFLAWSATIDGFLMEDVMSLDEFKTVAERAGFAEGLGDNRANGYGRFGVTVSETR